MDWSSKKHACSTIPRSVLSSVLLGEHSGDYPTLQGSCWTAQPRMGRRARVWLMEEHQANPDCLKGVRLFLGCSLLQPPLLQQGRRAQAHLQRRQNCQPAWLLNSTICSRGSLTKLQAASSLMAAVAEVVPLTARLALDPLSLTQAGQLLQHLVPSLLL